MSRIFLRYALLVFAVMFSGSATATPRTLKIYLAGPDVFLPNATEVAQQKKAAVAKFSAQHLGDRYEFEGAFPLDNTIADFRHDTTTAQKIFEANRNLMESCDFVIANMVYFRGPSMDTGTAYELGYMMASGKPVFGYFDPKEFYKDPALKKQASYADKVSLLGGKVQKLPSGQVKDGQGLEVENFGFTDNLMLEGTVRSFSPGVASSFQEALKYAKAYFDGLKEIPPYRNVPKSE